MNILFLCLSRVWDIEERGIYTDLLRECIRQGDRVFVVTPVERRFGEKTTLLDQGQAEILKVKTLNIQKTGFIEKGLGTVLLEWQYLRALKKYTKGRTFDLVLYATPPITLVRPIRYIKKRDRADTYLLLKDIFPQNAVDLGMMRTGGLKGILYRLFREKEKQLYALSDRIGCMSQANVDYLLEHNPGIDPAKVEVCPNSIEYTDLSLSGEERMAMRRQYQLPADRKIFVYGGNLGRPQGIPFLIECLRAEKDSDDVFFLIIGDGTEYGKLEDYVREEAPQNVRLMKRLPKEDYDRLTAACDVGMIFLDHRFTIPNFPSRLLSFMQAGLPVLACTDPHTDIGKVIMEGGFGWWCESDSARRFSELVKEATADPAGEKGKKALLRLKEWYTADRAYSIITKRKERQIP